MKKVFLIFIISCIHPMSFISYAQSDHTKQYEKKVKFTGLALPARTPENGWMLQGGIVSYFRTDNTDSLLRKSNIYLFGLYSQYNQYRISIGGDVIFPEEKFYLYAWIYYSYLPDLFFGVTNSNLETEGVNIEYTIQHLEGDLLYQFSPNYFTGITVDYEQITNLNFKSEIPGNLTPLEAPENYRIAGIGVKIRYDTRNDVMWPTNGRVISGSAKKIVDLTGSENYGGLFRFDFKWYKMSTNITRTVFSAGGYLESSVGDVPFRYIPSNNTRAYHPNKIRNKHIKTLILESRFKVYRFVELAVFGEICYASDKIFSTSGTIAPGFGPGIRLKVSKTDDIYLRLDYGFGINSQNFHLSFYNFF